jgi:outer membrane protein OmpA-like peptidoglycan-associated protein
VVLNNVFFDVDRYNLKQQSMVELNRLYEFMKANPKVKVEISGHTDNTGSEAANKTLSQNRAKSVADYLQSKGIPVSRLQYKGYGATKPVAGNDTEAGRALNRRTEAKITGVE